MSELSGMTGSPPPSRRRAVLGFGAVAALSVGTGLYRRRPWKTDSGLTAFEPHSAPRDLHPIRFSDEHGNEQALAAFRGRVVLLNVWATWCAPCREEMPTLDRLQAALGGPSFEVAAVSIDTQGLPVVQAFFRQIGVRHLHPYLDTFHDVAELVSIGVPLTLLIDRQGRETARKMGPATWDDPSVLATIRRCVDDKSARG